MNKMFAKITSVFTLSVFLMAAVLCCCTQQSVHASTEKKLPACHAQKAKADSPVKTDCSCCTSKQLQADSNAKVTLQAPSVNAMPIAALLEVDIHHLIKQKFNLAYLDGPPGLLSEVPLYLLFRSIRC